MGLDQVTIDDALEAFEDDVEVYMLALHDRMLYTRSFLPYRTADAID